MFSPVQWVARVHGDTSVPLSRSRRRHALVSRFTMRQSVPFGSAGLLALGRLIPAVPLHQTLFAGFFAERCRAHH